MFIRRVLNLFAIGCIAVAASAQTTTSSTFTRSLAPVGLASSETMQVNLLNDAAASSSGTAASCTGSVAFSNSTGTAIGGATSFTISSGEVFSVSLPFSKAGLSARGEIVAAITLTQTSGTPCALVSSLETFDTSTGVTHVFLVSGGPGFGGPGFGPGPGGH